MTYTNTGTRSSETLTRADRTFRPFRETKPSFMTTEFWALLAGVAAVVVVYAVSADTSFTLWRAMVLGTALGIGYMLSRGLAKSGSRDNRWDPGDPDTWRSDPRREGR